MQIFVCTVEQGWWIRMDDLISRKQAINILHEYFDTMLDTDTICPTDIYNSFESMPSAQKTGKWILKKELVPLSWDSSPLDYDNYDKDTHSEWKEFYFCSECGWKYDEFKGGNYCPNCGVRMKN